MYLKSDIYNYVYNIEQILLIKVIELLYNCVSGI